MRASRAGLLHDAVGCTSQTPPLTCPPTPMLCGAVLGRLELEHSVARVQVVCRPVFAVAMSESPDSTSQAEEAPLEIEINNDVGKDYTLIKVG